MIAMNGAPVWLLDIDGVLNAVADGPDDAVWPVDQWVRADARCAGSSWPLLAARPVVEFIHRVHRAGLAEIRWHTTWQEDAAGVARALGLPEFPVEPCPWFGDRWWKLLAVERVLHEGRPLLWTDDDATRRLAADGSHASCGSQERGAGRGTSGEARTQRPSALIISPRTSHGLTAAHLRRIALCLYRVRRCAAAPASGLTGSIRWAGWAARRRARQWSAPP
jgi:hypothetical protein